LNKAEEAFEDRQDKASVFRELKDESKDDGELGTDDWDLL
jgi:hypothetical protein